MLSWALRGVPLLVLGKPLLEVSWLLPAATSTLDLRRNGQDNFLFVWSAYNLHPDGQALRRRAYRHDRCWIAQEIKPLRVAHSVEILHGFAVDAPLAFAVPKCRYRTGRTEQHGEFLHLR